VCLVSGDELRLAAFAERAVLRNMAERTRHTFTRKIFPPKNGGVVKPVLFHREKCHIA